MWGVANSVLIQISLIGCIKIELSENKSEPNPINNIFSYISKEYWKYS